MTIALGTPIATMKHAGVMKATLLQEVFAVVEDHEGIAVS